MTTKHTCHESYDLTREVSLDSYGDTSYISHDEDESATGLLASHGSAKPTLSTWKSLPTSVKSLIRKIRPRLSRKHRPRKRRRPIGFWRRAWVRNIILLLYIFLASVVAATVLVGTFLPNYKSPPKHYRELQKNIIQSTGPGAGNLRNEKVYIAASLHDPKGELARGDWARNVLELVNILGPDNVYLSIFQNDSGDEAIEALADLETKVPCNHTLTAVPHLDLDEVPHVTLPNGTHRITRIAYLANVRNRALIPLDTIDTHFDKLLYLNDVMFKPIEAAQLLFSTHQDSTGRANYRAACAVDFINAFKFYDTFATRDLDGYGMGVPFFPWFSAGGGDGSLEDILAESDAVRVRSCWGGMVAFDARFFQKQIDPSNIPYTAAADSPSNITAPYKFREEPELWWDASECCLINADIQSPDTRNPGIFMNPYVRVAYDSKTLSWLGFTRRFEKLYVPIHFIADALVGLPYYNPRRHEIAWQKVDEWIWHNDETKPEGGAFHRESRIATHGGFCGYRKLQVIEENASAPGRHWQYIEPPPMIEA